MPDRQELSRHLAEAVRPLPDLDDPAFGLPFDGLGGVRVVLIGEATHGTSEFYRARAAITERLIREHGFDVVAIEGDWPDASRIDRHVRHREPAPPDSEPFSRFPTWMWRNEEVQEFVERLRAINADRPMDRRCGVYGLDLYSLGSSIGAVLDYLGRVDPDAARAARERYGCLEPWAEAPEAYGRAALTSGFGACEAGVLETLRDILARRLDYARRDGEAYLDAERNARVVAAAERYYRAMYYGSRDSWNLRDEHMFDTLRAVLEARGPRSKAVVWAHNSHCGDASSTEMGVRGEFNIGQLCRERIGAENVRLVGFGTDRGTVAAATHWDDPMEIKRVRPALPQSYERLFREAGRPRCMLDLRPAGHPDLIADLHETRLERAIGVIYRPETERQSHYFEADLPGQFDLYLWYEETSAVTPIPTARPHGAPDTWPFGL